jgi:PHD/YefM family antitoxin component YafN of YafNO toxin-antitoxin module
VISADELDSIRETIGVLSTPGAVEELRAAEAELGWR